MLSIIASFFALAKDGSTIDDSTLEIIDLKWNEKSRTFTKGETITEKNLYLSISGKPEKWVNFAGIEFITAEEARNLKK